MRLTDIFKFKLFDRTDKADLDVVNENFQNVETALNNCKQDLSNHKSSGDHDSRYYTETEVDGKLSEKSDTSHNHDGRYLQKSAVINSNTVTETGYALDARQANPNVSGSLGAQINSLNRTFTQRISELNTNFTQHINGYTINAATERNDLTWLVAVDGNTLKHREMRTLYVDKADGLNSFWASDGQSHRISFGFDSNSWNVIVYVDGVQIGKIVN